ncbi:hypothetical protein B0J17DRAFT_673977 [Rhizoctonia solani]|nr:hypothetical protein B0J17DRAFT_673977 [Rhizoctonia solani]
MRSEYIATAGQIKFAGHLIKFGTSLKSFSLHGSLGLPYFLAWRKIAQHMNFRLLMLKMSRFLEQRHLDPWQKCWSMFGSSLDLEEQFHSTAQCGYRRCAAPNTALLWEYFNCQSEWYCARKCQAADWVGQPNPHMHQCSSLKQGKH